MLHNIYAHTANLHHATVEQQHEFDNCTVLIVYVEYIGGGECYEYSILHDGEIMSSDSGYGSSSSALLGAIKLASYLGYIYPEAKENHA